MGEFSIIEAFNNFAELGAEWVMWLMLILGFGMIMLSIERFLLLSKTKVNAAQIARELVDHLDRGHAALAQMKIADGSSMEQRVLFDGLAQYGRGRLYVEQIMMSTLTRERQRYNRYLSYFGTIGNNAPFIGLFGTVIGIILAFKELGLNPKGGLEVIGPLISEALVATAVGLMVAIPAVVLFNWFKSEVKERLSNTDFLMRIVLAHLGQEQAQAQDQSAKTSAHAASAPERERVERDAHLINSVRENMPNPSVQRSQDTSVSRGQVSRGQVSRGQVSSGQAAQPQSPLGLTPKGSAPTPPTSNEEV